MQRAGGLVAALTHRLHGNIVRPKLVKGHVLQFLRLLVGPWAHLDLLAENHELLDHLALPFELLDLDALFITLLPFDLDTLIEISKCLCRHVALFLGIAQSQWLAKHEVALQLLDGVASLNLVAADDESLATEANIFLRMHLKDVDSDTREELVK